MGNGEDFDLSAELLAALPNDPYEQLDVAKRITSMAISSKVAKLEAEEKKLMQRLAEKDHIVTELQERLLDTEKNLQETTSRLTQTLDDQAKLVNEKNTLVATIKKLNRDVAKLEAFKRTLMQSLQEEEGIPSKQSERGSIGQLSEERKLDQQISKEGDAVKKENQNDVEGNAASGVDYAVPAVDSIPGVNDTVADTKEKPVVTVTISPTKFLTDSQSALSPFPFSLPASQAPTAPNSPPGGSLPGRTSKVDGKEFFRQARTRLKYEQFSAFLANIKELNAHRQQREETLKKAEEIFGPENRDLYLSFEGLLSRHLS